MDIQDLNEQEQNRRASLNALRELGIDPYPAAEHKVNATSAQIKAEFDPEKGDFADVAIAGRMMSRRIMGAASFIELQDEQGSKRADRLTLVPSGATLHTRIMYYDLLNWR